MAQTIYLHFVVNSKHGWGGCTQWSVDRTETVECLLKNASTDPSSQSRHSRQWLDLWPINSHDCARNIRDILTASGIAWSYPADSPNKQVSASTVMDDMRRKSLHTLLANANFEEACLP